MYLKRLEMKGFKSFADKINVNFDQGVTCIVGPNGSGKSNVTDAVRWVLGEQKARVLRGSKMEDIIFNGTNHRKKVGMAEVSLIFDNSDHIFPLDYNEVKVTRKLFRSGESEYSINSTVCRLKDVRELFMDTGIGTDGYSLIGQGKIDEILSKNKEDRRMLFEEAAGIVKYKSRKREAERKLDNTEVNLIRLEDIFNELEVRVEPLRIESEKATEFVEIDGRLKELELNLLISELENTKKKFDKEDEKFVELGTTKTKFDEDLQTKYNNRSQINSKIEKLTEELQLSKERFYKIESETQSCKGEKNTLEVKIQNTDGSKERISEEIKMLLAEINGLKEEINKAKAVLDNYDNSLLEMDNKFSNKNAAFETSGKRIYDFNTLINQTKEDGIAKLNSIEKLKSEITSYNAISGNLSERAKQLNTQKAEKLAIINEEGHSLDKVKIELEKATLDKNQIMNKRNEINSEIIGLKAKLQVSNDETEVLEKTLTKVKTEKNLLVAMEENFEGYSNSVKKMLQSCKRDEKLGRGVLGVLTSLMTIPKKYEVAIEIALGKSLQNIVVESVDDAKRGIKYLKENRIGRVTFLPLDNIEEKGDQEKIINKVRVNSGFIGKGNELFQYDEKYNTLFDYLLGRILIVDNVDTASALLKIPNLKYKIVTLGGDTFVPRGTITGGSYKSRSSELLGRQRKIDDLAKRSGELTTELEIKSEENTRIKGLMSTHNFKLADLDEQLEKSTTNDYDLKRTFDALTAKVTMQNSALETVSKEMLQLEKEISNSAVEIDKKRMDIKAFEATYELIEKDVEEKAETQKILIAEQDKLREDLTEVKVERMTFIQQRENLLRDFNRLTNEFNGKSQAVDNKNTQIDELGKHKGLYIEARVEIEKRMAELDQEKGSTEILLVNFDSEMAKHNKALSLANQTIKETNISLNAIKEDIHKVEIKRAKAEVIYQENLNRMWEKFELTYEEAIEMKKEVDVEGAIKEIRTIKKRLKEIGDVNISSIEEYEDVKERYEFLSVQIKDLRDSKNSLLEVIKELEKTMRVEFEEYYVQINENFSIIFQELFKGGTAKLEMNQDEDVLEADIEIVAQPPGKKLQSLSLLSGGEKALTAIALLFAILKTKPAPFCFLDEIEAALDDANVYRFADFLKDFTRNSQFIIITHRKGTMEVADTLYGVTMEEYGVSKLISVKMEDAS